MSATRIVALVIDGSSNVATQKRTAFDFGPRLAFANSFAGDRRFSASGAAQQNWTQKRS